jgi:anti-anti-sigma factor
MQITESNQDGVAVIGMVGRMDSTTSSEAERVISKHIDGSSKRILLEFSGLEYMSSAGLRALLLGVKKSKAVGATLILSGVREEIKEVLVVSGFVAFFKIYATKEEALKAAG